MMMMMLPRVALGSTYKSLMILKKKSLIVLNDKLFFGDPASDCHSVLIAMMMIMMMIMMMMVMMVMMVMMMVFT